jgi:hypothetical protein
VGEGVRVDPARQPDRGSQEKGWEPQIPSLQMLTGSEA